MKTLADLFSLIAEQTNKNDGMGVKYVFDVNTRYNWVSMYELVPVLEKEKDVFSHLSIETPEQLQQVYWTIFNSGRK